MTNKNGHDSIGSGDMVGIFEQGCGAVSSGLQGISPAASSGKG